MVSDLHVEPHEIINRFRDVANKAWIDIIRILNGPSYECHQRFAVFIDCFTYGFTYDESFDCALTCNNLPAIIFQADNRRAIKNGR